MRTWFFTAVLLLAVFTPLSAVFADGRDRKDDRATETHQAGNERARAAAPTISRPERVSVDRAPVVINHPVATSRPVMTPAFHPAPNQGVHEQHSAPVVFNHQIDTPRPVIAPTFHPAPSQVVHEVHTAPVVIEQHRPVVVVEQHRPVVIQEHRPVVVVERPRPMHVERHAPVVIVQRRPSFHTNSALVLAGIILAGAIIIGNNQPYCPPPPPLDPVAYAQQHGTYYSCRAEALANFKAKFIGVYTNDFAVEPTTRPAYIPTQTVYGDQTAYIVYCQQYRSYGFWDPADTNTWISYSVWDDDTLVDQLMLRSYYLYPTV